MTSEEDEMLSLKLRILEAIDRRLGHRVRILCRFAMHWNGLNWEEVDRLERRWGYKSNGDDDA